MQKPNYERQMEETFARLEQAGETPRLLLHSCCAPCSSAVLERLTAHVSLTVYYYNPNIQPEEEYRRRAAEQRRLLAEMPLARPADFLEGPYDPARWHEAVRGLEQEPEGGARCAACFALRLSQTAQAAKAGGFDYFTTTLSVSPLKNVQMLTKAAARAALETGIPYLYADFKKKDGYLRSIRLSARYGLYRQNFCGCPFSRAEAARRQS